MQIIIREAILADVEKIHTLGKDVGQFSVSEETIHFWPKEILEECVRSDTNWIILAEKEDIPVGFLVINYNPVFKKAIIENIFVVPELRGKGIAEELLACAVDTIQRSGCAYICTAVGEKGALELYTKNGFSEGKHFVWLDKILSKTFRKLD